MSWYIPSNISLVFPNKSATFLQNAICKFFSFTILNTVITNKWVIFFIIFSGNCSWLFEFELIAIWLYKIKNVIKLNSYFERILIYSININLNLLSYYKGDVIRIIDLKSKKPCTDGEFG